VSYVTLEYHAKGKAKKQEQKKQEQKKQQAKRQGAATVAVTGAETDTTKDRDQKPLPKDRLNYKCWSCSEKGHLGNRQLFLVSAVDPLNLTLQSKVENVSQTALGLALQGYLAVLRSRDFNPQLVYIDPHSSFRAMTQDFLGVEINVGGPGDYIAKVKAKYAGSKRRTAK
jgi:hypothetical protein